MVATKHFFSVYEFKEVLEKLSSLKLVLGDSSSTPNVRQSTDVEVLNIEDYWDLSRASEFKHPGPADPRSSVLLMVLTSGSTGPSKMVCISHYNIQANLLQWTSGFPRYLMCNPISHLSGNIFFLIIIASAETMFMASETLKEDPENYLDVCSKFKVESGLVVPVLFNKLAKYGTTNKLATFKRCFTGGSAIPLAVIDGFRALHPHVQIEIVYGSSEAGIVMQSAGQDKIHHYMVRPNVEFKIVDLNTNEVLGPKKNGMIWCKAPSVAIGYYNDEEDTKEAFVDGWQVTGDLGHRDDEGCLLIVDRVKQLVKCMDSQVVLADLEFLLAHDKDVLKVMVGGVPHEKFGEAAVAFVVPRKTANLSELRKRLTDNLESKLTFYKHLHGGLFFVSAIPETDTGKFSRHEIVERHLNKQLEYLD